MLERRNAVGFPLLPGNAGDGTGRGQDSAERRCRVRGPDPQGEWTARPRLKRPASIGLGRRDSMAGMIVAFSISPSGGDESGGVSEAVAEAVRVVRASGLPSETNAMFTNIEGEWDEVMAVVKQAVDVVAATSPRVGLVLKADIRPGYDGQLAAKVERIEQRLA